ncbi:hypothetical protein WJX72_006964 [[Myrmecia] bisecta]|uniref:Uncharacterized protein n=1 Tax=[Myrmecia] bisecta TaxID=41462 RepID=A0AAW1PTZ1_9CHLO
MYESVGPGSVLQPGSAIGYQAQQAGHSAYYAWPGYGCNAATLAGCAGLGKTYAPSTGYCASQAAPTASGYDLDAAYGTTAGGWVAPSAPGGTGLGAPGYGARWHFPTGIAYARAAGEPAYGQPAPAGAYCHPAAPTAWPAAPYGAFVGPAPQGRYSRPAQPGYQSIAAQAGAYGPAGQEYGQQHVAPMAYEWGAGRPAAAPAMQAFLGLHAGYSHAAVHAPPGVRQPTVASANAGRYHAAGTSAPRKAPWKVNGRCEARFSMTMRPRQPPIMRGGSSPL